jgi:hypothetical protein
VSYPRDSRVGQADRVEHATGELGDARWRVAATRFPRHGLGDKAPQLLQIEDSVELDPEASGARSENDGILKPPAKQLPGEILAAH